MQPQKPAILNRPSYQAAIVDPNRAPKEPVLLAAPIRIIYSLKFRLTVMQSLNLAKAVQ